MSRRRSDDLKSAQLLRDGDMLGIIDYDTDGKTPALWLRADWSTLYRRGNSAISVRPDTWERAKQEGVRRIIWYCPDKNLRVTAQRQGIESASPYKGRLQIKAFQRQPWPPNESFPPKPLRHVSVGEEPKEQEPAETGNLF